ncbi:hypothetical protein SAMN06295910_0075 [Allosphingosinicella indica]|uniref:Uncharacterized protein n=2 Tax=Allosphingosinicella indica TaxID=941907 RepID=A0A1X7FZK5_9SPHN|nr:hypothetical protein SAMN06295910_0075 [Allosphingosinicella indica]
MAYVDFAQTPALAALGGVVQPAAALPAARLTALEWSVVALARFDRLSSLATPGRLAVALGKVFRAGLHNLQLADPRLEALRRIAVLYWHHGSTLPAAEREAFHEVGFTPGQFDRMAASIDAARAQEKAAA